MNTICGLSFLCQVYGRWWEQWNTAIGWAEPLAYQLVAVLPEPSDKQHIQRVTIFRWIEASHALTYLDYAGCYQEFDEHMLSEPERSGAGIYQLHRRGLLTEEEIELIQNHGSQAPYDLPLVWAFDLLAKIEAENSSPSPSFGYQISKCREEILKNRACDAVYRGFDYIPVPIPQLQIISFAVYAYFVCNLFGRQFVMDKDKYAIRSAMLALHITADSSGMTRKWEPTTYPPQMIMCSHS